MSNFISRHHLVWWRCHTAIIWIISWANGSFLFFIFIRALCCACAVWINSFSSPLNYTECFTGAIKQNKESTPKARLNRRENEPNDVSQWEGNLNQAKQKCLNVVTVWWFYSQSVDTISGIKLTGGKKIASSVQDDWIGVAPCMFHQRFWSKVKFYQVIISYLEYER